MSPLPVLWHDHLDRRAAHRPDGEFAVPDGRRMTWAQARERSRRAARALEAAWLEPDDRFAVLAHDTIDHLLLSIAASRAGVVLVALDPRRPAAWDRTVVESAAMLLVLGSGFDRVRLPAMPVVDLDGLWEAASVEPAGQPGTDTGTEPCRRPA